MKLVILALKQKSNAKFYIYDSESRKQSVQVDSGETLNISILDPFPFNHFSSIDKYDEELFEKCYLEVEGELSEDEYKSMESGGIVYHRFDNRKVTILNEFHDIFQYSYGKLKEFGKKLGTYGLTTWILHSKTINAAEESAMKSIIFEAVKDRNYNKRYPLSINLSKYSIHYVDYFRELSEKGYYITFGKYGGSSLSSEEINTVNLSDKTLMYMLKEGSYRLSISHPNFTVEFYNNNIKNTDYELEFLSQFGKEDVEVLYHKGFNVDELYKTVYEMRVTYANYDDEKYKSIWDLFIDHQYTPLINESSPYDYYCCEDCDGYDIREMYTDDELEVTYDEVDERIEILHELLGDWSEYLSEASYKSFEFVSVKVLEGYQSEYSKSVFVEKLINHVNLDMKK